ncbi:MAG: adenylate/guanylate cyclase domain-containing protein [Treponema sp.]|nr:adenylate/guanylate cyclase domain-containing protein [Treponema sp.]
MIVRKKRYFYILISSLIFFLTIVLWKLNVFTFLENKLYDSRIKATAAYCKPDDDICFIAVDQESINQALAVNGWSWPWPREAYAQIIDFLTQGNAKSILMDVLFTEPSVYGEEDDELFAAVCKKSGRVVQTQLYSNNKNIVPIEPIKSACAFLGNINGTSDDDGIIRSANLSYNLDGNIIPSLGISPLVLNNQISAEELNQSFLLHYKGDINRYPHYSAWEIIESYNSIKRGDTPLLTPENFNDCHVFLLFYAPGLYDVCATPISKTYPGGGVHITTLDNYLNQDYIKKLPQFVTVLLILVFIIFAVFIVWYVEKRFFKISNLIIFPVIILFLFIFIFISFYLIKENIFIEVIPATVAFLLSFISTILFNYSFQRKQKRFIQSAFSQYLSPKVIDKLIENPNLLKLGGEKKHLSIMFSDIQSFTSLAESMKPEKLTSMLNEYLSEMSRIIIESGGTIDKYIGDAIVAFWNAPANIQNHAAVAVSTCLNYQKRLLKLNEYFNSKYGKKILARIGLATGDVVVGNMGSDLRFDYTMFGDSVNLASRLEGLNKQFNTYFICSQHTKNEAEDILTDVYWQNMGKIIVVGKTEPIEIFEPIKINDYLRNKEMYDLFTQGLNHFYSGDFIFAKKLFQKIVDSYKPAQKYLNQCNYFIENPGQWTGVLVADSK